MTRSEPGQKYKYRLLFLPSALKEWQALDGSIKEPLRKSLQKRLGNPRVPGGALHGELSGYYKIKLVKQGVGLVYGVEDDALIVMVMAVDRREDGQVYRSVVARVGAMVPVRGPPKRAAWSDRPAPGPCQRKPGRPRRSMAQ